MRCGINILVLCLLAVASCAKVTVDQDGGPMAFSVGEGQDTRALANFSDKMESDGQKFGVYATKSGAQVFKNQPQTVTYYSSSPVGWFYYGQESYVDGSKEYETWNRGSTYKFRAWYPYKYSPHTTSSSDLLTFDGFSLFVDNLDLMVAYEERVPSSQGTGEVKMNFHHALAAVQFKVQYKDGVKPEDAVDYVTSAWLSGVCATGTFAFGKVSSSDAADKMQWIVSSPGSLKLHEWTSASGTDKPFYVPGNATDPAVDVYAESSNPGYVFVIPQTLGSGAAFNFTTKASGSAVFTAQLPGNEWECGKKYTYTISVSASGIEVEVSIKPWEELASGWDVFI